MVIPGMTWRNWRAGFDDIRVCSYNHVPIGFSGSVFPARSPVTIASCRSAIYLRPTLRLIHRLPLGSTPLPRLQFSSRWQIFLRQIGGPSSVYAQGPCYSDLDEQFLSSLGISAVVHPEGFNLVDGETLVFSPPSSNDA